MTVKQLKEKLSTLPDDMEVWGIDSPYFSEPGHPYPIDYVDVWPPDRKVCSEQGLVKKDIVVLS